MPRHVFPKGNKGRPKGAVGKMTTVKATVLEVFQNLQDDPKHNLTAFAKLYPKDFYLIASKLIPTEIQADLSGETVIRIVRDENI